MKTLSQLLQALHRRLLPQIDDIGWTGYVWLIYLTTLFFSWIFRENVPRLEVAATIVSIPLFLPLYFYGFWTHGSRAWLPILGIFSIGASLLSINWGASVYFIYAAAYIGQLPNQRAALLTLAGIHISSILVAFLVDLHWIFLIPSLVFGTIVGLLNLRERQQARRRIRLRLDQDEVKRLAAMAERERIGRDLHDLLGHTLSLITIKTALTKRLIDSDLQRAKSELEDIEKVSRKAMEEVREAITGYRSAGLASELAQSRLALESRGIHFEYRFDARPLPDEVDQVLAMVLREAVTNVVRHANATQCHVRFERLETEGVLTIFDKRAKHTVPRGARSKGHQRAHRRP